MRVLNIVDRVNFLDVSNDQEIEAAHCLFFLMKGRDPQSDDLNSAGFLQNWTSFAPASLYCLSSRLSAVQRVFYWQRASFWSRSML